MAPVILDVPPGLASDVTRLNVLWGNALLISLIHVWSWDGQRVNYLCDGLDRPLNLWFRLIVIGHGFYRIQKDLPGVVSGNAICLVLVFDDFAKANAFSSIGHDVLVCFPKPELGGFGGFHDCSHIGTLSRELVETDPPAADHAAMIFFGRHWPNPK